MEPREKNAPINERLILDCLEKTWSDKSSTLWAPDNPARGQCGVTALVIQDHFSGEILKTLLPDGRWHYYNRIDGRRFDFTAGQFPRPIEYQDLISSRVEAFSDTSDAQYRYLGTEFSKRCQAYGAST
jgi:hypothetical protein